MSNLVKPPPALAAVVHDFRHCVRCACQASRPPDASQTKVPHRPLAYGHGLASLTRLTPAPTPTHVRSGVQLASTWQLLCCAACASVCAPPASTWLQRLIVQPWQRSGRLGHSFSHPRSCMHQRDTGQPRYPTAPGSTVAGTLAAQRMRRDSASAARLHSGRHTSHAEDVQRRAPSASAAWLQRGRRTGGAVPAAHHTHLGQSGGVGHGRGGPGDDDALEGPMLAALLAHVLRHPTMRMGVMSATRTGRMGTLGCCMHVPRLCGVHARSSARAQGARARHTPHARPAVLLE